jgi:outer membrane immunogenic protein
VKKCIACIAALLAFGMTGANAEEMTAPSSAFVTTKVPYLSWSGFYAGFNGGFAFGNSSIAYAPNDPAAQLGTCGGGPPPPPSLPRGQCIPSPDFRRDGALVGGQIGFNWQVNSRWLVGAEADYQWSDFKGSVSAPFRLGGVGNTNMNASQTVGSFGTVRARAGVLIIEPLLLYGTAGLALAQASENLAVPAVATGTLSSGGYSYSCTAGGASCFTGTPSNTLWGWSAGGGAELAITSNLTFKTELLYVHLEAPNAKAFATATASAATSPASFTASFSPVYFAVMRGGLNLRF